MYIIPQSEEYVMMFLLTDATDNETAETGLTSITCEISKNGGAFAAVTNSITEVSDGWYKVTLTTTETNTEGPLILRAIKSGTSNEFRWIAQVKADTVELATAQFNKIADYVMRRPMDSARASSDGDTVEKQSLLGALSKMVNKTALSGSTLTVYEEDNTTSFYTQTVTTDSDADPVTSVT